MFRNITGRNNTLSYQRKIIEEHYDHQARVQLDFKSYMKISVFICIGFSVLYTVFIYLMGDFSNSSVSAFGSILQFLPAIAISFVFSVVASLIMYPVYNWWCNKHRGQVMSGRFAMLREANEKSAETD